MQTSQQQLFPLQMLKTIAIFRHLQPNCLIELVFPTIVSLTSLLGQLSNQLLAGLHGELKGIIELAL